MITIKALNQIIPAIRKYVPGISPLPFGFLLLLLLSLFFFFSFYVFVLLRVA